MTAPGSILVVQTAFAGDVVLVLPLLQLLHEKFPGSMITAVTIPAAEELLANHPAVGRVIVYDKRGADKGPGGLIRMASRLRAAGIDVALIPHRSIRSALLCRLAGIPVRIGFDTSAGPCRKLTWSGSAPHRRRARRPRPQEVMPADAAPTTITNFWPAP